MADYTMKRFDTYPPLYATLSDSNGTINLTAASSCWLLMKSSVGTVIRASCVIASAAGGYVQHNWVATETNQADTWNMEWELCWNTASGVQTVPNDSFKTLLITADVENA